MIKLKVNSTYDIRVNWPIFALIILSFSCTVKKSESGQIRMALSEEVPHVDPALSYDTVSAEIVYQVHEAPLEYDYKARPYQLKPLLLKKMPIYDLKSSTLTLKVKENVFYHQDQCFGPIKRKLKAEDFAIQIKRLAFSPLRSPAWWTLKNRIVGLDEFRENSKDFKDILETEVKGLEVKDDETLIIHFKSFYPQFYHVLAMSFFSPVPKELVKCYANDLDSHLIGTGAFKVDELRKNQKITLLRNDDYHDQAPQIQSIEFNVMKESQTRWLSFLNKKIHAVDLSKDQLVAAIDERGELKQSYQDKGISAQRVKTLTYWWLGFNLMNESLKNKKWLREVIALSIDRKKWVELFTQNVSIVADKLLPPGIEGHDEIQPWPYSFDLEKAKSLLKQNGYEMGRGLPTYNFDLRGTGTIARQQGEFIKSSLSKVGINISVTLNPFPRYLEKAKNGDLVFFLDGWAMDYPDAENIFQLLMSENHPPGPNQSYFKDSDFDQNYHRFKTFGLKSEDKTKLMKNMNKIVQEKLPWHLLHYTRYYVLNHKELVNFHPDTIIRNYYKHLVLK